MSTRLDRLSKGSSVQVVSGTVADAIEVQHQLTHRDRHIISLLAQHHALTTEQITRVAFDSPITATHRLSLLTRRGVLARFRRCQRPGSQSWRYTLGTLAAMMHAAEHGQPIPRPSRVAERILALAQSPRLNHLLGINDLFTALLCHARHHDGCALTEWWSEREIGRSVEEIVRPDGYGEWTEHHPTQQPAQRRTVGFFLEYDTGTEPLGRLMAKLDAYTRLAAAEVYRPVLFVLPGVTRETNLHAEIRRHSHRVRGLVVATATTDHMAAGHRTASGRSTGHSPAGPVWLVAGTNRRVRLIDLPSPVGTIGHRSGSPETHDETHAETHGDTSVA